MDGRTPDGRSVMQCVGWWLWCDGGGGTVAMVEVVVVPCRLRTESLLIRRWIQTASMPAKCIIAPNGITLRAWFLSLPNGACNYHMTGRRDIRLLSQLSLSWKC